MNIITDNKWVGNNANRQTPFQIWVVFQKGDLEKKQYMHPKCENTAIQPRAHNSIVNNTFLRE